ncbi:MAG: hypothetical protein LBM17_06130 [Candidatus Accumulibacter sp.]|nr:hypothetical protein [Accumulibacter sp.]
MCGGGGTPKVVERDPQAEAEAAAAEAAKKANQEAAEKKKRYKGSSLLASGARGVSGSAANSLLEQARGKDLLGK